MAPGGRQLTHAGGVVGGRQGFRTLLVPLLGIGPATRVSPPGLPSIGVPPQPGAGCAP